MDKMRTMVIGANGALGSDFLNVLGRNNITALNHDDIEISDPESVARAFLRYSPELVINTAAFHNVPECEKDDLKAFKVNAFGAKLLAENCRRHNSVFVHISTDYVFSGVKKSPYDEDSLPSPLNAYGVSKLAGEHYIRAAMEKFFIIRTSGLYGINKCRAKGGNFVDTMLRLSKKQEEIKIVGDEILAPTYTLDLAKQVVELARGREYGLYHATNSGQCAWYEFAEFIFGFLNMKNVRLVKIFQKDFLSPVRRPVYSVLDNRKLKSLGIYTMRPWQEALSAYLDKRKELGLL